MKRDIGLRLTLLTRLLRNDFDRRVAQHGITRSQWSMIAVVGSKPGASQRTIAELLEMSEASAGRLIDRLCNEGLLERRSRDQDRRAREVYLTPAAHEVLDKIGEIARAREAEIFKGLGPQELEALLASINRIYRNVTETSDRQVRDFVAQVES
ncbi:MarR family winged helix-turn-helix transcriptional regulator [Sphingomonas tabacisoli]|uniref:MarR family winged helix-turn-helix transcriptional regulator n=1 Tax=Sphingomonas tabacisoli TaxID=2249466 RepID=A0ABW4I7N2_9SPHN